MQQNIPIDFTRNKHSICQKDSPRKIIRVKMTAVLSNKALAFSNARDRTKDTLSINRSVLLHDAILDIKVIFQKLIELYNCYLMIQESKNRMI